ERKCCCARNTFKLATPRASEDALETSDLPRQWGHLRRPSARRPPGQEQASRQHHLPARPPHKRDAAHRVHPACQRRAAYRARGSPRCGAEQGPRALVVHLCDGRRFQGRAHRGPARGGPRREDPSSQHRKAQPYLPWRRAQRHPRRLRLPSAAPPQVRARRRHGQRLLTARRCSVSSSPGPHRHRSLAILLRARNILLRHLLHGRGLREFVRHLPPVGVDARQVKAQRSFDDLHLLAF
ncbi:hypothetical protein T484DRAFT_1921976, partial [Baffinella frigidus]